MRTETITRDIYEFEELPAEVQAKVLEDFRYREVENCEWYELVIEDWADRLSRLGFMDPKIYFTMDGHGACFDCDDIDLLPLWNAFIRSRKIHNELDTEHLIDFAEPELRVLQHRYSHKHTREFYLNYVFDGDDIDEFADDFESYVDTIRLAACDRIYKALEAEEAWVTSDEYVRDYLLNGDYEFLEDGTEV